MKEVDEWVQEQSEGPAWPTVPGYRVLAAAGSFDITSMRRELVEEHLFLRGDLERPHDELEKALGALPRALILGRPFALYDDISPTGVAAIAPDLAGSIPNYAIMLCPVLTQQINLHSDPGNPMSYLDEDGIPVVRTIWWRDGGVRFRAAVESPVRGDGHVIVVSETIWPKVAPYLAGRPVSYRWRHATSHDSGTKEYQSKSCKWLASE
jgi:hypothetical protein